MRVWFNLSEVAGILVFLTANIWMICIFSYLRWPAGSVSFGTLQVGRNGGHGEVHQSGGTVSAGGGWFGITNDGAAPSGLYDLNGGQLTVTAGAIEVGAEGSGELRVTGTGQLTSNAIHLGQRGGGTGTLNVGNSAIVTVNGQIVVGFGSANANVFNLNGGTVSVSDRVSIGTAGNVGTANLVGGSLTTGSIEAGGGTASLNLGATTIRANQTQPDFIRGFTNSAGHSAINLTETGPTIDTNGFDVRITQANVFADADGLVNGLNGTVVTKTGAGTLTIESATDTDGTVAFHAVQGTSDFESSQTLDTLDIGGGATVTLSDLASAPAPAESGAALFEGGSSSSLNSVQGVPEPGAISLLVMGALAITGRRRQRSKS